MIAEVENEFDVYALADEVRLELNRDRSSAAVIQIVVSPFLPRYFSGNKNRIATLIHALADTAVRRDKPAALLLAPAGTSANDIQKLRICANPHGRVPLREDARSARDVLNQLVTQLGGTLAGENSHDDTIVSVEIPLRIARADAENTLHGAGRLLIVTSSPTKTHPLENVLTAHSGLDIQKTSREADAVGILAQGIRTARPIQLVSIDTDVALNDEGLNHFHDLCSNAAAAGIPVFLFAGDAPETDAVVHGYAGHMATPDLTVVLRALNQTHADLATDDADERIVRVEPWAWRNRKNLQKSSRILVVDDNRTNLLIVEGILSTAGYSVDMVTDSEEALQKLLDTPYRLAILDIHMPGSMDGVTMLKRYRALGGSIKVPVVFLTASTDMDMTRTCAEAGADAYLTKPVKKESLLSTLAALIREREIQDERDDPAPANPLADEPPLVNSSVLRQVVDPNSPLMKEILHTFESEGATLIRKLMEASAGKYAMYADVVRALKAVAITVGAEALVAACHQAEAMSVGEFEREGYRKVDELDRLFRDTVDAVKIKLEK